jgi:hypothetical protein
MRHREVPTPEQARDLDALDRALAGEPVELDLRELEALVGDVRATGPEMTPAFAARLEQAVADGFPSSQQRPPISVRRPWAGRRWVLLPAAGSLAAVLVALVVVLGGGGNGEPTATQVSRDGSASSATEAAVPAQPAAGAAADSATGRPAPAAPDESAKAQRSAAPAPAQSSGAAGGSAGGSSLSIAPAPSSRKVERSAVLVIQTPDGRFEATTDAVNATVARFRGIVASAQSGSSDADGGEATFELRIPTERLDQALAALAKLGHVTERSQNLQDITGSFTSAQERLTDARAERRGLLRALARATTQQQIAAIKAELRTVSSRISGLKGRLASLRRRADLSTVNLTVRGGGSSQTGGGSGGGGPWTPGDAAGDALRVLEVSAGVALVCLAVLAPLGLLGGAIALAVRSGRRRRRETALDPA